MYPTLLEIGAFKVHSYGVLFALDFFLSVWFITSNAKKVDLDAEKQMDMAFWVFFLGMLGGRILFIITQFSYYMKNPGKMFAVWEGGFVFYGGLIMAAGVMYYHSKKYKFSLLDSYDLFAPAACIAHGFGRIGCFFAGCCYGVPTDFPLGMKFSSNLIPEEFRDVHIHPTQLYAATALAGLFVLLLWVFKNRKWRGQVVVTYFGLYAIIRSLLETIRGDKSREFIIEDTLSTSQGISILFFMTAVGLYIKNRPQKSN
jgi:phosphatidylglycerol:prolipoprotein diacylglycerol transferase